jgi:hypothetical protein
MSILGSGLLSVSSPQPNPNVDPYLSSVVLFLKGNGTNAQVQNHHRATEFTNCPKTEAWSCFWRLLNHLVQRKVNMVAVVFDPFAWHKQLVLIGTPVDSIYTLGSDNFTLEMWVYPFSRWPLAGSLRSGMPTRQCLLAPYLDSSTGGGAFSFWRQTQL